jgi:L-ascorbate metabolism protein UlaG (beta-lactamase superfamily)
MKQFGGKITKELSNRYSQSSNWRNGKFQNLETTTMEFSFRDMPKILHKQFFDRKNREPKQRISVAPFDREQFLASEATQCIWYGHSVILLRVNGKNILIDPMLGPDAAPIAPFKSKRFSENTLNLIDHFPEIDLLLMTHDHYDHLDLASIKKLAPKVKQYAVGLGVRRHLTYWGIESHRVNELDWWDQLQMDGLTITYTPTRHFSGRGLGDREKSLWGGWVIDAGTEKIYFSGDGGYGEHFKEIGTRLGPFDFGIMECGQYNEHWHQIHMYPEESIQAAIDAKCAAAMPVHWAGFALAMHDWKDPVERFKAEAIDKKLGILTPQIGESFDYKNYVSLDWWINME